MIDNSFLQLIAAGFGFGKACYYLGLDPKEVTEYLNEVQDELQQVRMATVSSMQTQLSTIEFYQKNNQFSKFDTARQKLLNFEPHLVLWESLCTEYLFRTEIDKYMILIKKYECSYNQAVCVGMSHNDFMLLKHNYIK